MVSSHSSVSPVTPSFAEQFFINLATSLVLIIVVWLVLSKDGAKGLHYYLSMGVGESPQVVILAGVGCRAGTRLAPQVVEFGCHYGRERGIHS